MKRVLFLILIINLLFLVSCKEERIMISFNPNNGEDIILIEFKDGDFNLPTDPNKDGYKFIGWYYDDQVISLDNIKTGMVLVAKYEKIETYYNVYFDSNGGDYILPLKVLENDKVSEPSNPVKEGYEFIGWYYGDTLWDFEMQVKQDIVLTAKWNKNKFTVVIDYNIEGVSTESYFIDEYVTKPSDPTKEGYRFMGWYSEDKIWNFDDKVDEDLYLYAKWEKIIYYTVVFEDEDGEIISSVKVEENSLLTDVPNVNREGYEFIGWYNGNKLWDLEKDLVTSGMVLVAKFNKI